MGDRTERLAEGSILIVLVILFLILFAMHSPLPSLASMPPNNEPRVEVWYDDDYLVQYRGSWARISDPQSFRQGYHLTTEVGASYELKTHGRGFMLSYYANGIQSRMCLYNTTCYAEVEVYVNGQPNHHALITENGKFFGYNSDRVDNFAVQVVLMDGTLTVDQWGWWSDSVEARFPILGVSR